MAPEGSSPSQRHVIGSYLFAYYVMGKLGAFTVVKMCITVL